MWSNTRRMILKIAQLLEEDLSPDQSDSDAKIRRAGETRVTLPVGRGFCRETLISYLLGLAGRINT